MIKITFFDPHFSHVIIRNPLLLATPIKTHPTPIKTDSTVK